MILSTIGLAVFGYFAGVLVVMGIGVLGLSIRTELQEGDTLSKLPEFMKRYEAIQSVAWRWPLVLPVGLAASVGVVVGFVVGRTLRSLRRAYRRVLG